MRGGRGEAQSQGAANGTGDPRMCPLSPYTPETAAGRAGGSVRTGLAKPHLACVLSGGGWQSLEKQISMGSVTRSIRTSATVGGRLLPNPLRCLLVALMVTLVGCATQERAPDLPPPVAIPESTWW